MRVSKEFDGNPRSAAVARCFVRATLAAWELTDLSGVAALLSSELVSNAIRHSGADYKVALELDPPELRVEVVDPSRRLPVPPTNAPADSVSGRGLRLVDALALRWGTRLLDEGKAVWFALSVGRPSPLA